MDIPGEPGVDTGEEGGGEEEEEDRHAICQFFNPNIYPKVHKLCQTQMSNKTA